MPHRAELQVDEVRELAACESFAFYRYKNVAINVWLARPDVAGAQRLLDLTAESARRSPQARLSSVHLLDQRVGIPTSEARALFAQTLTRHRDHVACIAAVLAGEGFWVSALLGAITGVMALLPSPVPLRYFTHTRELAQWLPAEHLRLAGERVQEAELIACLSEAQRQSSRFVAA
jgi:hypothetical protein